MSERDATSKVALTAVAKYALIDEQMLELEKSIPQELDRIVPNLPSVPIQPLILDSQHEYAMFEHFARFPWVLPVYHYTDEKTLLLYMKESIINPAEQKAKELAQR